MWGIAIRAHGSCERYWQLVDEASRFEAAPSMRPLGYGAHLTFTTYREIEPERLRAGLAAFAGQAPLTLRFSAIGVFDVEPMVLWLKPDAEPLLAMLHDRIHAILGMECCEPYYRPGAWQPHCTLASAIAPDMRAAARAFAGHAIQPFSLTFDVAEALSWPPPTSIASCNLEGGAAL
jgi:2'-5' RNA ligase